MILSCCVGIRKLSDLGILSIFLKFLVVKQVILQDVQAALNLWLSIDIQDFCCIDGNFEMTAENMTPLLCSIADLLAMKVRLADHATGKLCLCSIHGSVVPMRCNILTLRASPRDAWSFSLTSASY